LQPRGTVDQLTIRHTQAGARQAYRRYFAAVTDLEGFLPARSSLSEDFGNRRDRITEPAITTPINKSDQVIGNLPPNNSQGSAVLLAVLVGLSMPSENDGGAAVGTVAHISFGVLLSLKSRVTPFEIAS
jgi:hypothetical protein